MARLLRVLLWIVGLAVFTSMAIPAWRGELVAFDRPIHEWLQARRTSPVDTALKVFTFFGGGLALVPWSLVILTLLLVRRHFRTGIAFWAYAVGVVVFEVGGKHLFGRPRPLIAPEDVVDFGDFGFPSGHALASTALYGMLAFVLSRYASSSLVRAAIVAGGLFFALTVCATRVYYAKHWPSDVIAGFALGLTYLSIVWSTRVFEPARAP
jgi:undecaprenyl-diphosphatase